MKTTIALAVVGIAGAAAAQPTEILASSDYMSSGFFFPSSLDLVRGEEANSIRSANRVSPEIISGVTGENAYFSFDFDPSAFSGPVPEAVIRVEVVPGFFADPTTTDPASVSIHSVASDPLATIDQTIATGPSSFLDFRDTQITTSSIISTTDVTGLGVFDWDITALVNDWIANGDANNAFALGTSVLTDATGSTAAFVNSTWTGLTDEVTARIVVIPAPASAALLGLGGLAAVRRRR
ncbi:MAG: PEP-CTERM sorting domain-containing protein [Planctomycetota bacterium]